ncbi:MAG: CapA family protein [Oscillospiraceae bacterium]|nr:CapA family protein [Oscillospiraceae bacterium]
MALDPEELKRRRQERQERRKQQQASRKALFVKLGIALGALVLCAVLIFVLTNLPGKQTATPSETAAPSATVIRLAACGDLNVTQRVVDAGDTEHGYSDLLMNVTPLLAQADVTVMNFEGNFFGAPYGADRSAPESLARSLADAGVDLLQLANSYSIYKGMDGLASTVNTVRAAGIEPVGAYANAQEAKESKGYTIRNIGGVKLAFVAFTKGMDGMALPPGNEGCVNLLYTDYSSDYRNVDTEGILKVINAAKKERPDMIVALLHWGSEFNNTISKTQEDICSLLQENGVGAIIGTHSHYVQRMYIDQETGCFVAYSLGDFLGDADRAGSEYSVILELEISKELKSGKTQVTDFSYTPIFTANEVGKPLRVLSIRESMAAYKSGYIDRISESTYNAMDYALGRINARIHATAEGEQPIQETTEATESTDTTENS